MKGRLSLSSFVIALTLLWLMGGCATLGRPPITWQREDAAGHELTLVDPRYVESYRLQANGLAMVTIGEKGESFAAPVMYWRIKDGRLVISEDEDARSEFRRFTLLEKRAGEVSVCTKWGSRKVFKIR